MPTFDDAYLEAKHVVSWAQFQKHSPAKLRSTGDAWIADINGHLFIETVQMLTIARGFTETSGRKENSATLTHKDLRLSASITWFKSGSNIRTVVSVISMA